MYSFAILIFFMYLFLCSMYNIIMIIIIIFQWKQIPPYFFCCYVPPYLGLELQLLVENRPLLQDLHLEALFVPVKKWWELAGVGQPPLCLHHLLLLPSLGCLPLILVYPVENVLHHLVAYNHPGQTQTWEGRVGRELITDLCPPNLYKLQRIINRCFIE